MRKLRVLLITSLIPFSLVGAISCAEPVDSDGDGWSDAQEVRAATNPNNVDTDNDGYWDPYDSNPLNAEIPGDTGATKPEVESPAPAPTQPTETTPSSTSEAPSPSPQAAAAEELRKVQDAVQVMMRNNKLSQLPNPVRIPTRDMHRFPDDTTRHGQAGIGYVLFLHDFNGDGTPDTNYFYSRTAKGTYICDEYGNITQVSTGYE